MGRCRKGKKQENIEGLECRRNVFGRGYFSLFCLCQYVRQDSLDYYFITDIRTIFVENRYDFDDRENWKGAYCIIRN